MITVGEKEQESDDYSMYFGSVYNSVNERQDYMTELFRRIKESQDKLTKIDTETQNLANANIGETKNIDMKGYMKLMKEFDIVERA